MKKLFFALACVIGMMTFAGCTQEQIDDLMAQKPTVEFVAADGYVSSNTSVYVGTELNFKVKIAPNSGSNSELTNFDFSITDLTGFTVYNNKPTLATPSEEMTFSFVYVSETPSTFLVTATVTDAAGKTNIAKVTVDYVQSVAEGLGTFAGTMNVYGHITSNQIQNIPPYDEDYNLTDLAVEAVLGTIGDENRVAATLEIDGTPVTLYATLEGDTLTFDEFHFFKEIELQPTNVTLDLLMNMTGVMNDDDTITLSGTCAGSGSTMIIVVAFTVNMEGTIEGTLEKQAE